MIHLPSGVHNRIIGRVASRGVICTCVCGDQSPLRHVRHVGYSRACQMYKIGLPQMPCQLTGTETWFGVATQG